MNGRKIIRLVALATAIVALTAACSSDKKSSSASGSGASSAAPAVSFVSLGGWNDGPCDASKPKIEIGITNPINAPGTSLAGYVDGSQAAVAAFNQRGGIEGGCLDLKVCDSKGDGPTELACARDQSGDSSIVADVASTYTSGEGDAYQLFEASGLPQVGAQVTLPNGWNSPVAYEFTMGGSGTLLADIPALKSVGVTKFDVMIPQSGQAGALKAFATPLVNALGMQMLNIIEIPPTAVDFTQFVQQAENDGAEGVALGLPGNVAGQVIDAADSLNSTLKLSGSWGSFSQKVVSSINPDIAKNMAFEDAVPPLATDLSRWPIYNVILDDFKASGNANLTQDTGTVQAVNGWLSVYALIKVMRDSKAPQVTRTSVKAAFDAAKNVDMFNVIPPWTPSLQSTNAIFKGISNSLYYTGHWDGSSKQFVVDQQPVDILKLLG